MLCIGGATVDRTYRLGGPLRRGTSNPVASRRGFGGVARNVADNLARLGSEAALATLVGADDDGRALVADLDVLGVATAGVVPVPDAATATYVAVLTEAGELALGLADMAIFAGLGPDILGGCAAALRAADWAFVDCNVTAELLATLARPERTSRYRLAVDPVSIAKSARLPESLAGIDLLVLNRDEADAYLERRGRAGLSPEGAAAALLEAGAGAVVLTLGRHGALAATADDIVAVSATAAEVVDVTGAGDALIAAVLHFLMRGLPLPDAVAFGCRAAALTVASPTTVSFQLAARLEILSAGHEIKMPSDNDPKA